MTKLKFRALALRARNVSFQSALKGGELSFFNKFYSPNVFFYFHTDAAPQFI